ncbi:glycosyltransferase family 4 protein [Micromonospora haikouensis]|uniref:glycosyltransferase family 4 protein n=1 Tax=Micromonospora haikouensis TaxID=686309 RepID=UPI0037919920
MRVVVTSEARFQRTPDGAVWTPDGPDHGFWTRYLSAFDEVRVAARTEQTDRVGELARRVDGPGVQVWPVPYYVGPRQYLAARRAVAEAVGRAADDGDAVILRVPSAIGSLLAARRGRRGLPYALEVVADPYDVFAPGTLDHPLRPLLRRRFAGRLRRQCATAVAVSYVTESYLQSRYPAAPGAPTTAASSIELPGSAFVPRPRTVTGPAAAQWTLVTVGTMDQLYKGVDTLIEAVARLAAGGLPVRLTHIGTGRFQPHLEALARRHGVADRVTFHGWCPPGEPLHRQLDAADLFVMPSRTEGLPRALVEAMARALPALGTRVGGIPELLAPSDLVRPGDPVALATAVADLLADAARMTAASARNLARAREFATTELTPRRTAFYQEVRRTMAQHGSRRDRAEPTLTG